MTDPFLLVVFDGLRPDMVQPHTTPNLLRLARMGTRFAHARSVFPSETRVCSASVATGCMPRRHGLVANRFAHPLDPARSVDTGQMATLVSLEQETGSPVLEVPTLGEALAAAGQDLAVLSSGTTGQTWVLNPKAEALGQLTLSVHGPQACSARGRALFARVSPPPAAAPARAAWIADLFREQVLPAPPAATILWLCEPDTTGHYRGLGSVAQIAALRVADAAFGRILDDWQAGPQRDRLQIAVASDHGQATITGHQDVAAALAGYAMLADCAVLQGSSGGILVPVGDSRRIAMAAEWLTRQDWTGCVFAADGTMLPEAVLPRSAVLADHRRAAPVLFTLRTMADTSSAGLPGTTLHDGDLATGAGTHGGLSPAEMHISLMLAGSRIRAGISELPAGLVDIAPTILALLGLPGGEAMDGRVLAEAFAAGDPAMDAPVRESLDARAGFYAQHLARTRLGRHVYLDAGFRAENSAGPPA